MEIAIPPTIYIAGPNQKDASINRAASRQPVKQAPIAEPAESPVRESRTTKGEQPISLPPPLSLDAKGRLALPTGTGTQLHLLA